MYQQKLRSNKGIHLSVVCILLFFIYMFSVAFPRPWNTVAGKVDDLTGIRLQLSEEPYKLGLDLQGGVHLLYEADMTEIAKADRISALEGVREVIERRVNAYGVSEPLVQTTINNDHYRIVIELAGIFDIEEAIALIGETPILEFKIPNDIKTEELEVTSEQAEQIAMAQKIQRKEALVVLDKAVNGEDFGILAREYSIDKSTYANDGYVGFVSEYDTQYGELIAQIEKKKYLADVIDGLYEYDSTIHVMKYISKRMDESAQLAHILVCHDESQGCENTRTRDEAIALISDIRSKATADNFADLAKQYSEDGSAQAGGDLGEVMQGIMVEPFENAYLALQNGEISDVVETSFGYHIIYRKSSKEIPAYELAHIEMDWTTESDVLQVDLWKNTELSGKYLSSAAVAFDPNTGSPYVQLNFNQEGGDIFGNLTNDRVGDVIGIFLDSQAISTPVVQEAIYGGQATITGNFSIQEAKLLAQRLNAGALPVPISILSQQTVGPTLGQQSLTKSIQAGIGGLILIALFMVLYYRLPGILAVVALAVYIACNLLLYKWLGVTMTLAGIAGFILSLGMAVDANVLIFERLKEELASGRDLPTAIDEGFRRAWTSIRDGNITTLIASTVLFSISTSFVKGFALTLSLGVLISMTSAIFVTRVFLKWAVIYKPMQMRWLYGERRKIRRFGNQNNV